MKKYVFHPFVFSLYPVFFLYANNLGRSAFADSLRTIGLVLVATGLLFFLFNRIVHNVYRAGLVTSLIVLLFSTFGGVYSLLQGKAILGLPLGRADVLAALWAAVTILTGWWLIRVSSHPKRLSFILNVTALFLITFPLIQMCYTSIQDSIHPQRMPNPEAYHRYPLLVVPQSPPDIYYLVLDEYGRSDVLKDLLSYDNSEFISYLKDKGFYVADQSHTNYAITHLSIASTMNYDYLDSASSQATHSSNNSAMIAEMIRNSRVRQDLVKAGYKFVTFPTGYYFTDLADSDRSVQGIGYLNGFEISYLNNTLLTFGMDQIQAAQTRGLINNSLDGLMKVPAMDPGRPKFVFDHILAAHTPFVFGPNGEALTPWTFSFPGQGQAGGGYGERYTQQLTYINQRLEKIIDYLLEKSATRPIILLQGDHGPESRIDWYSVDRTCLRERMSNLSAFYFPDEDYHLLYPSISLVNTFPVIFDTYFSANLGLHPDKSYFSLWDTSYDFIDVTNRVNTCGTVTIPAG
jgi:hypothetical protein